MGQHGVTELAFTSQGQFVQHSSAFPIPRKVQGPDPTVSMNRLEFNKDL
jgi:hypothetical protein